MSAAEKPPNLEELDPRYAAVLAYLERGWQPLAANGIAYLADDGSPVCQCKDGEKCSSPGKHPRGTWANAQTGTAYIRGPEELERKLPPGKPWNVALTFGSGGLADCVALDVDSGQARAELLEKFGLDIGAASCRQATANGWHVVYRIPAERVAELPDTSKLRNGAGVFTIAGVDIRHGNGIIIAEPSMHASGRRYFWEQLGEPDEAPEGFWALMATRGQTEAEKPKPAPEPSSSGSTSKPSSSRPESLHRRRVRRAVEEACAKIAGTPAASGKGQRGRNDAANATAYGLGIALCLRSEVEQREAVAALKGAAEVQTPPSDPDHENRLEVIEEAFEKGRAAGLSGAGKEYNDPIPPDNVPASSKPSNSSSSASSEEPADDPDAGFRPGLRWVRLSELDAPKRVEWLEGELALGRIPRVGLTLIMGEPGVGKGNITAQIVAEVTNAGRVVIVSAPEDDLETVTLPRYIAAGAKMENVIAVGYAWEEDDQLAPPNLAEHAGELLELATEHAAAAIILDPIEEHLEAKVTSERETRLELRKLRSGCSAIKCALIGVDHPNRMASPSAYARAGGSSAKYKLARSVLIVAKQDAPAASDPAEQSNASHEAVLIAAKLSVGPKARGLRFEIGREYVTGEDGEPVSTGYARLLGETTLTAEEVLGEEAHAQSQTVSECAEWLAAYLELRGMGHEQDPTRKDAKDVNSDWTADILKLAVKSLGGSQGPMNGPRSTWGYKLPGYRPLGADRD